MELGARPAVGTAGCSWQRTMVARTFLLSVPWWKTQCTALLRTENTTQGFRFAVSTLSSDHPGFPSKSFFGLPKITWWLSGTPLGRKALCWTQLTQRSWRAGKQYWAVVVFTKSHRENGKLASITANVWLLDPPMDRPWLTKGGCTCHWNNCYCTKKIHEAIG